MKIAIIKIGALGDVVRTTILLPALKEMYPEAEISWITGHEGISLLSGHPFIHNLILVDDIELKAWQKQNFDWIISLEDDAKSCDLATRAKSKKLSGAFMLPSGALSYTDDLSEWFGMGILRSSDNGGLLVANEIKKRNRKTHGQIFYSGLKLRGPIARPFIPMDSRNVDNAAALFATWNLTGKGSTIGLNTGAGSRWKFKSWGIEQTTQLAVRLQEEFQANVILLGGPAESIRNQLIFSVANRGRLVLAPTNLSPKDFTAVLDRLDLLITSDSLALHLGNVVATKMITFFGPTSEAEIDAYENGTKIGTGLSCACCYLKDCQVAPNCMESITVNSMLETISNLGIFPSESVRDSDLAFDQK